MNCVFRASGSRKEIGTYTHSPSTASASMISLPWHESAAGTTQLLLATSDPRSSGTSEAFNGTWNKQEPYFRTLSSLHSMSVFDSMPINGQVVTLPTAPQVP